MSAEKVRVRYSDFPIEACTEDGALAVITLTEGPAYRSVGAAMAIADGAVLAGSLSSGCIERDVALHARALRKVRTLRYGSGSPFFDIRLPCGGALEVTLLPRPADVVLSAIGEARARRVSCELSLTAEGLSLGTAASPILEFTLEPDLAFHVFGKGPEARMFAGIVHSAGFEVRLLSHDEETLNLARVPVTRITPGVMPDPAHFDAYSAVVLFFHDHHLEPPILSAASRSPAFYVGAQGSRRSRATRDLALRDLGVPEESIARMKGPIGLLQRARDARTLAVSVLAEVVEAAR